MVYPSCYAFLGPPLVLSHPEYAPHVRPLISVLGTSNPPRSLFEGANICAS